MHAEELLQGQPDACPQPQKDKKTGTSKLLKLFNTYYRHQERECVSYLPLLIYCLAYNNYLLFIENPEDEENLLFKIKLEDISKDNSENDSNSDLNKTIGVGYAVPKDELSEWEEVIKYFQKDFYDRIEIFNEQNILYNLLVEGKKNPIIEEEVKLYRYAKEIAATLKENKDVPDLRECVMWHLSKIDFWTQKIVRNQKLLYFIKEMLRPLNYATIYNPIAGPGIETFFLNSTQVYHGYTASQKAYYLGKLLILSRKRWNNCTWKLLTNNMQGIGTYNYAIVDFELELQDGVSYHPKRDQDYKDYKVMNSLLNIALDKLDEKGKMVCAIPDPIDSREIIKPAISKILNNNWLRKIVAFRDDLVLLYIDKDEDPDDPMTLFSIEYDYINHLFGTYSSDDWNNLKDRELFLETSPFEIEMEDYFLTYNHVAKQIIKNEAQDDFYFIRLGTFLTETENTKATEKPQYQIMREELPKLINKDYPLHATITSIETDVTNDRSKYCKIVSRPSLLFDSSALEPFRPLVFDDSFGDVYTNTSSLAIDTNKVNPEYLVLEISKAYFQEQIRQSLEYRKDWPGKNIIDLLLSLYIKIPNCRTSLERQKQIVDTARWRHIEETALNIGHDLSVFSSADNTYLKKGTKLGNGKYTIHNYLGHGGFGRTYLAMNNKPLPGEPTKVAIKEFFVNNYQLRNAETNEVIPQPGQDIDLIETARKKFRHEADKILKLMNSPFIIDVYDVFDENNTTYYVMEYVEKGDLRRYTELIGNGNGLSESEAKRIITEVAQGVKAMHSIQMNHLDIKPSNILITKDGHVRVIDFGTVRDFSRGHQMTTICNISSHGFSAPELNNLNGFSPQADIYSLGATLKYMLEGTATADDESGFMSATVISPKMQSLIDKCMNTDPIRRPKDVDDFLSELNKC